MSLREHWLTVDRIFTFNYLTDNTTYETIPLKYTPRKMVSHNDTGLFYVIQSENNTLNDATRQNLIKDAIRDYKLTGVIFSGAIWDSSW